MTEGHRLFSIVETIIPIAFQVASILGQGRKPFKLPHGILPACGGLELHFAVVDALGDLGGVSLGEFGTAFCVAQDVVDAQAAFIFGYGHFHADFLAEAGRADVF